MLNQNSPLIIADSHVHIHDCFFIDKLLDNALKNFQQHLTPEQYSNSFKILFLTEIVGDNYFSQLVNYANNEQKINNWSFKLTQEDTSLCAEDKDGQQIYLIAGRQIVTQEKMEVLSLINPNLIPDSLPLEETIEQIINSGGLPVLPWGVGKWIGTRGKLLQQLLTNNKFPYLFLGDNRGRPQFWTRSPYFKLASEKQIKILPGSDLLALKSEVERAGSFGFTINANLDSATPGQSLKKILISSNNAIASYGNLQSPIKFFQNQLAIRL